MFLSFRPFFRVFRVFRGQSTKHTKYTKKNLRGGKRFRRIAVQRMRRKAPSPHCNPSTSFRPAQIFFPSQLPGEGRGNDEIRERQETRNYPCLSASVRGSFFSSLSFRVFRVFRGRSCWRVESRSAMHLYQIGKNILVKNIVACGGRLANRRTHCRTRSARVCFFAQDVFASFPSIFWLRLTAAPRSPRPLRFNSLSNSGRPASPFKMSVAVSIRANPRHPRFVSSFVLFV